MFVFVLCLVPAAGSVECSPDAQGAIALSFTFHDYDLPSPIYYPPFEEVSSEVNWATGVQKQQLGWGSASGAYGRAEGSTRRVKHVSKGAGESGLTLAGVKSGGGGGKCRNVN